MMRPSSARGQSSVVGVVLLLGVTVLTVSGLLLFGGSALGEMQNQVNADRGELLAGSFVKSANSVTDGGASTQRFDTGGIRTTVREEEGWVRVASGGEVITKETLGTVEFGDGDSRTVMQGGALFQVNGDQAVLTHGGGISYRGDTVQLNLLRIQGNSSTSQRLLLRAEGQSQGVSDETSSLMTNLTKNQTVTVTIQSRYYRAWGEHFASEAAVDPTYDQENETVTVRFVPGDTADEVQAGIIAGTPTSSIKLSGGMSMDSYDSANGSYTESKGGSGQIIAAGDFTLSGGARLEGGLETNGNVTVTGGSTLEGLLETGGDFTLSGGSEIAIPDSSVYGDARVANNATVEYGTSFDGTLVYGGELEDEGDNVPESRNEPVSVNVGTPGSIAEQVDRTVEDTKKTNDNDQVGTIDSNRINCTDGTCELPSGAYYLDELSLKDEDLVLNTAEGNITLVIDGDFDIDSDEKVRVEGDGRVNVFLTGDYSQSGSAAVETPEDRAPQFWLYPHPETTPEVTLDGGGRFVGVMYGPGVPIDVGPVPIYGAVVGDISFVGSGAEIHYDTALDQYSPVPRSEGTVPTQYTYVSVDSVNVTSS